MIGKTIRQQYFELQRIEQSLRTEWLKKLYQSVEYKQYLAGIRALELDCESVTGHKPGRHHDNGLGWEWDYCSECGAKFNVQQYNIGTNND